MKKGTGKVNCPIMARECSLAGRCICAPFVRHRARFPWPPRIEGLDTPDFLLNVRGSFAPQAVLDEEIRQRQSVIATESGPSVVERLPSFPSPGEVE